MTPLHDWVPGDAALSVISIGPAAWFICAAFLWPWITDMPELQDPLGQLVRCRYQSRPRAAIDTGSPLPITR
jgi:hypothetical protein